MNDPNDNIEFICQCCGDERTKLWQEANKETVIKVGDMVKVGIDVTPEWNKVVDEVVKEHMWIEITRTEGDLYQGKLRVDPVFLDKEWGDSLTFDRKDISQRIKEKEWAFYKLNQTTSEKNQNLPN